MFESCCFPASSQVHSTTFSGSTSAPPFCTHFQQTEFQCEPGESGSFFHRICTFILSGIIQQNYETRILISGFCLMTCYRQLDKRNRSEHHSVLLDVQLPYSWSTANNSSKGLSNRWGNIRNSVIA